MTTREKLFGALPTIERYAMAVLAVVCTLAIRLVLNPMLGDRAPYLLFFLVIILVKRLWGWGPSLLATVLGGLAAWYFILAPEFSFAIASRADTLNLVVYFAVGAGISFLGEQFVRMPAAVKLGPKIVRFRVIRQTVVLAGAVAVLAGMVLLLSRDFERTQEAEARVAHSYRVIGSAESIFTLMNDAETSERGYLLTGEGDYLPPFHAAVAAVPASLKEIKDLTADNPVQQARWAVIDRIAAKRLGLLQHGLDLRRAGDAAGALAVVRSGEGAALMANLRGTMNDFLGEEHRLSVLRNARAQQSAARGRWILGLGSGALVLLLVLASVVIERETVEREEITRSLRRHADLLEQSHDSLLTCRLRGSIDYWSRGAQALFGYTREEALGRSSHELLHTRHPLGTDQIDALLAQNGHWEGELTQTAKDGRTLTVEAHWVLATDPDGKTTVLEANHDVTARKRAEALQRESETQFRNLANAIPQLCWMANADGFIFWYNERWYRYTGTTPEQMEGWGWQSVHDPAALPSVLERWKDSIATGQPFDMVFPLRGADGVFRPFLTRIVPVRDQAGKVVRWFGTNTDIGEQRRIEEALRVSEQRLHLAIDAAELGTWDFNPVTGQLDWSDRCKALFGLKPDAVVTYPAFLACLHPDDRDRIEQVTQQAMDPSGSGEFRTEYRAVGPDGTERWIAAAGKTSFSNYHSPRHAVRFIGTVMDISERKQAEKELRESEAILRSFFDSPGMIRGMVELVDSRIIHVSCNEAAAQLFGIARAAIIGKNATEAGASEDVVQSWLALYQRAQSTGKPVSGEYARRDAQGRERWLLATASYMGLARSGYPRFAYTILDLTERRRAEEGLRQSEARLRALGDNLPEGAIYRYRVDAQGQHHVEFISAGIERLTGVPATEFMHQIATVSRSIAPEDRERLAAAIESSRQHLTRFEVEVRHQHRATGELRWSLMRSTPSRAADGSTVWDGIEIDITERKRAEEALRESEGRERARAAEFEALMEVAPVGIFRSDDTECRWMSGNRRAYDILRQPRASNLSQSGPEGEKPVNFRALKDGKEIPLAELPMQKAAATGQSVRDCEMEFVFVDGVTRIVLGDAVPLLDESGHSRGAVGAFVDITERKRAEEALRESEAKLAAALASMTDAVFISDDQGRFIHFNDAFATYHKFRDRDECFKTLGEYPGILEGFLPDGTLAPLEMWAVPRALRGETATNAEYGLRRKDTGETWVGSYSFGPIRDKHGTIVGSVVVARDVTDAKRAQVALRESEARFRSVLDNSKDVIYRQNLQTGRYEYVSPAAEAVTGYAAEEFLAMGPATAQTMIHPDDVPAVRSALEGLGAEEKAEVEYRWRTKAGGYRWLSNHFFFLEDGAGHRLYRDGILRDITERKRGEAERVLLATAIEQAAETVVVTDSAANIQYVNPAFTRTTGFTRAEAYGQNPRLLKSGRHDAQFYQELWSTLAAGQLWHGEFTNRCKDGRLIVEDATIAPVRDASGTITNYIAIKSDVTERKQKELALRESELMLRFFVQHAPAAIAMFDRDMRYLVVSQRWLADYQLKEQDLVGRSHYQVFPEVPERWKEIHRNCLAGGVESCDDDMFPRLSGGIDWVRWECRPWRKIDGSIGGIIIFSEVITERKRAQIALQESELRYRQLFERSESALAVHQMVFDAEGVPRDYRFLDVNPAFERDTGLKRSQVVGRRALEVLPELEEFWLQLYGRVAATGEPANFESYTRSLDRYYAGSAYSPRPNQFAVSFMDVTERKRAEENVRRLNLELEERVRVRTAALETANRELEAFAHSVSHDLRAPLRGIDGWSQALLEDYGESLDAQARKYLGRVRAEAQRMGGLIDDLLHLSRVSRTELIPTAVDLTALAAAIATRLREAYPKRCLEFVLEPGLECTGDPRLLEIALTNLLNNAVKFTGTRPAARVEFGRTTEHERPTFFVRDNGVGFDMNYAKMLFAPFQRLHKASEFPGTGIGLATVQRVIHRHGGKIWAEAKVGEGATFFFTVGESKA